MNLITRVLGKGPAKNIPAEGILFVSRSAFQGVTPATELTILFDSLGINRNFQYDPVTGIVTILENGIYLFLANIIAGTGGGSTVTATAFRISKNFPTTDTAIALYSLETGVYTTPAATNGPSYSIQGIAAMQRGDTVRVRLTYQGTGTGRVSGASSLTAIRLG